MIERSSIEHFANILFSVKCDLVLGRKGYKEFRESQALFHSFILGSLGYLHSRRLGIFGGDVLLGFPNPDAISNQNM